MRVRLEIFQNESGMEGVDFIVKTKADNYLELFLTHTYLTHLVHPTKIMLRRPFVF